MAILGAALRLFLKGEEKNLNILGGPLRGGTFYSSPRASMRKVFGVYEHELNGWLSAALQKADIVIDVGANDGYLTFGAAAAMRRLNKPVKVISIDPQAVCAEQLKSARLQGGYSEAEINIVQKFVGVADGKDVISLDDLAPVGDAPATGALIKIDVEGAEIDVLANASRWLNSGNYFVIEVHRREFLEQIKQQFSSHGLQLDQINQQPHPILGREQRDENNWWLVSRLS